MPFGKSIYNIIYREIINGTIEKFVCSGSAEMQKILDISKSIGYNTFEYDISKAMKVLSRDLLSVREGQSPAEN